MSGLGFFPGGRAAYIEALWLEEREQISHLVKANKNAQSMAEQVRLNVAIEQVKEQYAKKRQDAKRSFF